MIADSWLFVPAIERYIYGNGKTSARNIIYDLEDSLKEEQKEEGLRLVAEALANGADSQNIYVRVNSGQRMEWELRRLRELRFSGYFLPKFEGTHVLDEHGNLLEGREIIALIESPAGVVHLEDFAQDSRICGFAFGGEDFCSCLGVPTNEDATRYARGKIALWASYAGKIALDTVCFETEDMSYFGERMEETLRMGFSSRLLIHPRQMRVLERLAESLDMDRAEAIVREYEVAGTGVVVADGKVYERPHIERLKRLLEERRAELDDR